MVRTFTMPTRPDDANPWGVYDTITAQIKVITPMFGGGVQVGEPDKATPISAKAIRGHLRFWWRATRGMLCQDVASLRKREAEIWGNTDNPSPVAVEVTRVMTQGYRHPPNFGLFGPEAYALFSAKQNESVLWKEGIDFTLRLVFPKFDKLKALRIAANRERYPRDKSKWVPDIEDIGADVQAALWAWVNFGGIGARTRRGCGALFCESANDNSRQTLKLTPSEAEHLGDWLKQMWSEYALRTPVQCNWPILQDFLYVGPKEEDAISAWSAAIKPMRDFRQGATGRNGGRGRSFWPEAESVRAETQQNDRRHGPDPNIPDCLIASCPRADFGLPIVIHFKNAERVPPGGIPNFATAVNRHDPYDTELLPVVGQKIGSRMASSLVLRPLGLGPVTGFVPMVCKLATPPLENAALVNQKLRAANGGPTELKRFDRNTHIVHADFATHSTYTRSPLCGRSASGSAVEAFLAFIQERTNGFVERWRL